MNEEEIIKTLNYQLKMKDTDVYTPINYDAIQGLLDLYTKQQKEIEKLKDKLNEERNFNKSALETLKECVHKDKIKEIKEEYEKERSNMTQIIFSKYGKTQQTFKQAVYNEVIKVLDELLGGNKDE